MAFVRWPHFHLHAARESDWHLCSTSGVSASLGTPEVKFALDAGHIVIPLNQMRDGKIVRQIVLEGEGHGCGVGAGIMVPFVNFGVSPSAAPGIGTPLWQSPFSPPEMEPRDFKGVCWALSASHTDVGAQASSSCLVFCDEVSLYSLLPASVNAVGACVGVGFQSAIVSISYDAIAYTLKLRS